MACVTCGPDDTELRAQGAPVRCVNFRKLLGFRLQNFGLLGEVTPLLPDYGLCSSRSLRAAWRKLRRDFARQFVYRARIRGNTLQLLVGAETFAGRKQSFPHVSHQYHAFSYNARGVFVALVRQRRARHDKYES